MCVSTADEIGDEGGAAIGRSLESNASLQHLNLYNSMSDWLLCCGRGPVDGGLGWRLNQSADRVCQWS